MPLDLSSLQRSIASLTRATQISENMELMDQCDHAMRDVIRAGVIQNFEITYELSHKLLDRWLRDELALSTNALGSRRNRYRIASEHGLIQDFEVWMGYHEARNATSHIYDEDRFNDVYPVAVQFRHDAQSLLSQLEARND